MPPAFADPNDTTPAAASDGPPDARAVRQGLVGLSIALPFVFPITAGPSASVWQLLATWACLALLLLLTDPAARSRRVIPAWLALGALAVLCSATADVAVALAVVVVLWGIGLSAWIGSRLARQAAGGLRPVALALVGAGIVNALLGLLQYYGHAQPLVPWTTAPELGQAYGNLRQRNQFATLISMALISALWLLGTVTVGRARVALGAAIVLFAVAAAASTSRTGLLQWLLIVGAASVAAWRERRSVAGSGTGTASAAAGHRPRHRLPHPGLLLALIPLYFGASWLLPWLAAPSVETMLGRLREGAPDAHSRLVLWRNVLELIAQHPWAGWGWGELKFAHFSTLYAGPRFVEILDNAHNLPLHLAVELGVPAAVAICGGFTWMVLAARPWRESDPSRLMVWGLLGVIVLHSLLEYPLWYGPFQLAFGLCLGFLWSAPGRLAADTAPNRSSRLRPSPRALSTACAATLLGSVLYTGWDYVRVSQIYLARDERLPSLQDRTLDKVRDSWLFAGTVQFAELALTPVDARNAAEIHALARRAMHFSPEPTVVVKLIESAHLMGLEDEALAVAQRFGIAYPREYMNWLKGRPLDDSGDQSPVEASPAT